MVYDTSLLTLCRDHGVVFQAYNVMNGLLSSDVARNSPKAFQVLRLVGQELEDEKTAKAAAATGRLRDDDGVKAAAVAAAAADTDLRCRGWAFNDGQCLENPAFMLTGCAKSCAHFRRDRPFAVGASSVVLRWLVQQGVATIPRAASSYHLEANGPYAIANVGLLSDGQMERVARAARALLGGNDEGGTFRDATFDEDEDKKEGAGGSGGRVEEEAKPVVATFVNSYTLPKEDSSSSNGDSSNNSVRRVRGGTTAAAGAPMSHEEEVHAKAAAAAAAALVSVFWVHAETGEEVLAAGPLKPGEAATLHTHPGHTFVARPAGALHGGSSNKKEEGGSVGGVDGGAAPAAVAATVAAAPVMGVGHARQPRLARFEVTAPAGGAQNFHIGAQDEL